MQGSIGPINIRNVAEAILWFALIDNQDTGISEQELVQKTGLSVEWLRDILSWYIKIELITSRPQEVGSDETAGTIYQLTLPTRLIAIVTQDQ